MPAPVHAQPDSEGVAPTGRQLLETLFEREYTPMVRVAYTLLGDKAEAEEVVQEAFVDVHRRIGELREPGAFLRTVVVNRARSALRRRHTRDHAVLPRSEPVPAPAGELWDVLGRFPDEQRMALVLRCHGRYRATEIAEAIGCPTATVRSWLRRGLATLREELA